MASGCSGAVGKSSLGEQVSPDPTEPLRHPDPSVPTPRWQSHGGGHSDGVKEPLWHLQQGSRSKEHGVSDQSRHLACSQGPLKEKVNLPRLGPEHLSLAILGKNCPYTTHALLGCFALFTVSRKALCSRPQSFQRSGVPYCRPERRHPPCCPGTSSLPRPQTSPHNRMGEQAPHLDPLPLQPPCSCCWEPQNLHPACRRWG